MRDPLFTPCEYTRYNAAKAESEFGRPMTPEAFRAARKRKLAWMRGRIAGFGSVADYGAGSGWLEDLCAEEGIRYVPVDEIAEKDAFTRIDPVDLVVSVTVLEHMTPPEVMRFVEVAGTKARHLLIVTNNPRCAFSHFALWDDITHVRLYSRESVSALLQVKGWDVVEAFYEDRVVPRGSLRALFCGILGRLLGPMFLNNVYNYWGILARNRQTPSTSTP